MTHKIDIKGMLSSVEPEGDYFYYADHWNCTYGKEDLDVLEEGIEDSDPGEIVEIGVLKKLPNLYAFHAPTVFDEHGNGEQWETLYFLTKEAAEQAARKLEEKYNGIMSL